MPPISGRTRDVLASGSSRRCLRATGRWLSYGHDPLHDSDGYSVQPAALIPADQPSDRRSDPTDVHCFQPTMIDLVLARLHVSPFCRNGRRHAFEAQTGAPASSASGPGVGLSTAGLSRVDPVSRFSPTCYRRESTVHHAWWVDRVQVNHPRLCSLGPHLVSAAPGTAGSASLTGLFHGLVTWQEAPA